MTFTDFKQMQPTATLKTESVLDYVELLCQVLRTNYQTWSIQMHRDSIAKDEGNLEYHKQNLIILFRS